MILYISLSFWVVNRFFFLIASIDFRKKCVHFGHRNFFSEISSHLKKLYQFTCLKLSNVL